MKRGKRKREEIAVNGTPGRGASAAAGKGAHTSPGRCDVGRFFGIWAISDCFREREWEGERSNMLVGMAFRGDRV